MHDAPQTWHKNIWKAMRDLGLEPSTLHSSALYHRLRNVIVVIHVDDFLCSGKMDDMHWLYEAVKEMCDMKHTISRRDSEKEVKRLNRTVRWTPRGSTSTSIGLSGGPLVDQNGTGMRSMSRSYRKSGPWISAVWWIPPSLETVRIATTMD